MRLKGRNGNIREYPAFLSSTFDYCAIPKVDAFALGYSEAAGAGHEHLVRAQNILDFVSSGTYERGALIKMSNVELGHMSFKDVEFLTYDLLQATGVDVILGKSLFQGMKLEIDFSSHRFKLEKTVT